MFMIYVITLSATLTMQVYFSYQTQIKLLLANKVSIEVLFKYLDYIDIFLFHLIMELPKNTSINKHTIKLVKDK